MSSSMRFFVATRFVLVTVACAAAGATDENECVDVDDVIFMQTARHHDAARAAPTTGTPSSARSAMLISDPAGATAGDTASATTVSFTTTGATTAAATAAALEAPATTAPPKAQVAADKAEEAANTAVGEAALADKTADAEKAATAAAIAAASLANKLQITKYKVAETAAEAATAATEAAALAIANAPGLDAAAEDSDTSAEESPKAPYLGSGVSDAKDSATEAIGNMKDAMEKVTGTSEDKNLAAPLQAAAGYKTGAIKNKSEDEESGKNVEDNSDQNGAGKPEDGKSGEAAVGVGETTATTTVATAAPTAAEGADGDDGAGGGNGGGGVGGGGYGGGQNGGAKGMLQESARLPVELTPSKWLSLKVDARAIADSAVAEAVSTADAAARAADVAAADAAAVPDAMTVDSLQPNIASNINLTVDGNMNLNGNDLDQVISEVKRVVGSTVETD